MKLKQYCTGKRKYYADRFTFRRFRVCWQ